MKLIKVAGLILLSSMTVACGQNDNSEMNKTAMVERGAYLVRGVAACGHCHTPYASPKDEFAGNEFIPNNYAPNITPDVETGIGSWSEADIEMALKEGVRPDGTNIHPVMPYLFYTNATDEDIKSIVAYLKSVPAINNPMPKGMTIPATDDWFVKPLPYATNDERVSKGAYLATLGHCMRCHTGTSADGKPDYENQLGAGGTVFFGPDGAVVASNITPDENDGIAFYTVDNFKHLFKTGERPDGTRVSPIMGIDYYKTMSDEDMENIALYLKSLPAKPLSVKE